jgi:5'-AMP-activated protein kinase catalytic alpha subunit
MTHNYYFPDNISDEAVDLIENMLKIDPSERYDFEQIKSHPWFNLVEPKLKPGIVYGVHKIPIDENILKKVENFGYDKDKCMKSIENNNYDSYSSIYYLTLKQFIRENKSSISDLFSDEYLNYLKDYKNWLKPEEINNPLFMNYEVEMPFEVEQEKAKNYISNALLAYNDKNRKKNKNIEAIPEEESKNCNDFDVNLNYPLSTKNNNNSVNKRVFNNEIEKYKKEEEEKLNMTMEERSKEQKNKSTKGKNNKNYKTEKKLNLNSPNLSNINSSIVANMNKNKGFNKKQGGGGVAEVNSSAKKIQNTSLYSNIYSNIKTTFKKQKIRKNASYGEMPFNELNNINIKDIIKKRVKNKKRSVDDIKEDIYSVKMKEKNKLVDLSNSKDKIIKKNNKVNEDDNKSTKNNNKDNYNTEMSLNNNDNINKNKKKEKKKKKRK